MVFTNVSNEYKKEEEEKDKDDDDDKQGEKKTNLLLWPNKFRQWPQQETRPKEETLGLV